MSSERYSRETVIPAAGRWISYLLKCIVIVSAGLGVFLSARAGRRVFMGGNRVFMYFTIQSNIAVAIISAVCAVRMIRAGSMKRYEFIVQYVGAVAITLTGVVFCFILAPVLGPRAWNLQNVLIDGDKIRPELESAFNKAIKKAEKVTKIISSAILVPTVVAK